MLSTEKLDTQLFPMFALCALVLVAVFLWFLVIVCMTFVLIRDKKQLTLSQMSLLNGDHHVVHLERVNSAQF